MFDDRILDVLFTFQSDPMNENRHRVIREAGRNLAQVIVDNAPSSADTSSAIRHVRNAVMEANAAVACEKALLEAEMEILSEEDEAETVKTVKAPEGSTLPAVESGESTIKIEDGE